MKTLVHISDLHFGRHNPGVLGPLAASVKRIKPHVLVVSGDLTHRGFKDQYRQAKQFLNRLPFPKIIVPGNHDLPYYNLPARFLDPLRNFSSYIADTAEPVLVTDEVAVVGINTTRPWALTGGGRITKKQLFRLHKVLTDISDDRVKIIVSHHPFDQPKGQAPRSVRGARRAMRLLTAAGADVFLGGHMHISHISHDPARYRRIVDRSALVVQAGTSSSRHVVREPYCFNVLKVERDHIAIERHVWQPGSDGFNAESPRQFRKSERGWIEQTGF